MSGMHGKQLVDKVLELYPDIKNHYMSGNTEDVIAHHGVMDEGVQFIEKPFNIAALEEKIRQSVAPGPIGDLSRSPSKG